MICDSCRKAADTKSPRLHTKCKPGCYCQHEPIGAGGRITPVAEKSATEESKDKS